MAIAGYTLLELSTVFSALSSPFLVYLYYRMYNNQNKQTKIQDKQTEIMSKQSKIISADHAPILQINNHYLEYSNSKFKSEITGDSHSIELSNVGNGVATDISTVCEVFISKKQKEDLFAGMPISFPMNSWGYHSYQWPTTRESRNSSYVYMDEGGVIEPGEKDVMLQAPIDFHRVDVPTALDDSPDRRTRSGLATLAEIIEEAPKDDAEKIEIRIKLHYKDAAEEEHSVRLLVIELPDDLDPQDDYTLVDAAKDGDVVVGNPILPDGQEARMDISEGISNV